MKGMIDISLLLPRGRAGVRLVRPCQDPGPPASFLPVLLLGCVVAAACAPLLLASSRPVIPPAFEHETWRRLSQSQPFPPGAHPRPARYRTHGEKGEDFTTNQRGEHNGQRRRRRPPSTIGRQRIGLMRRDQPAPMRREKHDGSARSNNHAPRRLALRGLQASEGRAGIFPIVHMSYTVWTIYASSGGISYIVWTIKQPRSVHVLQLMDNQRAGQGVPFIGQSKICQ